TLPVPSPSPGTPVAESPKPRPIPADVGRPGRLLMEERARPGAGIRSTQPEPESGMSAENPTGRQEPALSLEWIGPPTARVGQPADYTLVVRNVCNIPVQQVLVRVRIPNGMAITATEPKA